MSAYNLARLSCRTDCGHRALGGPVQGTPQDRCAARTPSRTQGAVVSGTDLRQRGGVVHGGCRGAIFAPDQGSTRLSCIPAFLLSVLASMTVVACSDSMERADLESLGQRALEEYCSREDVRPIDFSAPVITKEREHDWVIEYQSMTRPKHVLILFVKNKRIVDRHRLVE